MKLATRTVRDEGLRPYTGTLTPFFDEVEGWDPFTEMATLRRTMNSILDSALHPIGTEGRTTAWVPAIDLYEKNGQYHVECAIPGVKKDDVNIEVSDNRLTITAKRFEERIDENARYQHQEIRRGVFTRTIVFPTEVDANNVTAIFDNGILKITVPSAKPVTTKKVPIKG
jgi:HSP20 family protein